MLGATLRTLFFLVESFPGRDSKLYQTYSHGAATVFPYMFTEKEEYMSDDGKWLKYGATMEFEGFLGLDRFLDLYEFWKRGSLLLDPDKRQRAAALLEDQPLIRDVQGPFESTEALRAVDEAWKVESTGAA